MDYLEGVNEVKDIQRSTYGEFISATAPIHIWESEFDTEFHLFSHVKHNTAVIRATSYSLPESVVEHVHAVYNTIEFPLRKQFNNNMESTEDIYTHSTDSAITARKLTTNYLTPATLRAYYNVSVAQTGSASLSQSVMESNQYYSPSDLSKFQTMNSLPTSPVYRVYGGHNSDQACYGMRDD